MSAFKWLAFVLGVILAAAVGAIINELVLPTIEIMNTQSTTAASSQGIAWYETFWTWMPLVVLMLLVFALFVGVIVRRRRTVV
jgi:predicted outer membrane lipoprotein